MRKAAHLQSASEVSSVSVSVTVKRTRPNLREPKPHIPDLPHACPHPRKGGSGRLLETSERNPPDTARPMQRWAARRRATTALRSTALWRNRRVRGKGGADATCHLSRGIQRDREGSALAATATRIARIATPPSQAGALQREHDVAHAQDAHADCPTSQRAIERTRVRVLRGRLRCRARARARQDTADARKNSRHDMQRVPSQGWCYAQETPRAVACATEPAKSRRSTCLGSYPRPKSMAACTPSSPHLRGLSSQARLQAASPVHTA